MTLTESETQEAGATLRRSTPTGEWVYTVFLLERLPASEQTGSSGLLYRALVTWYDGCVKYDPAFLLRPFTPGWEILVDPRGRVPAEKM